MNSIRRLKNSVQPYAWGSPTAIPRLLGRDNPEATPWAELWMGAHPKAPSLVETGAGWESLETVVRRDPAGILGQTLARRFQGRFPFLFKVLAAAAPLSIQAHPSKEQAEKGFAAENRAEIPLDDPERNYRDDNHKPECICAVEPFWALCGFRKISNILGGMQELSVPELADPLDVLRRHPDRNGLQRFFKRLMTADEETQKRWVRGAVAASRARGAEAPVYEWVVRLGSAYPDDIGVLFPLILNLIRLEPGQALFLPAGELHAYLEGVGIELMANSDNVIRGGLTGKHVDVPELMTVLNFDEREIDVVIPHPLSDEERVYSVPAAEFRLSVLEIAGSSGSYYDNEGVAILLCVGGNATLKGPGGEWALTVERGEAVLVPAGVEGYWIQGTGGFFKAATPRWPEGTNRIDPPPEPS